MWDYYERHPQMQGWFPFGLYAGGTNNLMAPGTSREERSEWFLDLQALQGCNAIWGQHPTIYGIARDADDNPIGCNAFGERLYGESLPEREMRIWPSLTNWLRYRLPIWDDMKRMEPLASDAEMAAKAEALAPVLDFARKLRENYPETVVGFITDDEPSFLAPAVAAQRLLNEHAGAPAMTCLPSWGGFQSFSRHMQPITGDFYVTSDGGDNSWSIAERMRWIRENQPQRVFYLLPLASAYHGAHEQTLPDLKDSRPSVEDMRMQFWMGLAGGAKGYFYYHLLYNTWWAKGEDNLLNLVLQANNELWPELGRQAAIATTIGPCLVPCQPIEAESIGIESGSVRFIEYQGPALSVGLLQDITRPERHFLLPWNNDVRERQSGTLTLPAELLTGRQLYDLHDLALVSLTEGRLPITLEAGGGRIFLIGTDEDFAACEAIIREARVRQPRVTARILRRLYARQPGAVTSAVDALIAEAATAEAAGDWGEAEERYGAAIAAIRELEKKVPYLLDTRRHLDAVAAVLSTSDDLLRTHTEVLGIDYSAWPLETYYKLPLAGPVIRDFVVLVGQYLGSRIAERNGELNGHLLRDRAIVLLEQATANKQRLEDAIEVALAESRLPIRVAYFTADRYVVEDNMNLAWLYKNATSGWFVPDEAGVWRDRDGNAWDGSEWDAVWVHQLLSATPKEVSLLPALTAHREALADFVQQGGGLILTGLAGQLVVELGLEQVPPDRVRECSTHGQSLTIGLAPAAGMAAHPALTSLADAGFVYTNASFPGNDYFAEFAWEERAPTGQVIAVEHDQLFGAIGTYAAMVEYVHGRGKVIVCGGRACDFTPGQPHGLQNLRSVHLRTNLRAILRDTLAYAAADQRFTPDAAAVAAVGQPRQRPVSLPFDGWAFRLDPEQVGEDQNWMAPDPPPGEWDTISIGANWESLGYDYNGIAWYRRSVTLHNRPGQRTMLHFGAVDEQATVWIDGKRVGHHRGEPNGWEAWDQPFAMDITDFVTAEPTEHLLTVRVHDISAAGGIWKPVWVEWSQQ